MLGFQQVSTCFQHSRSVGPAVRGQGVGPVLPTLEQAELTAVAEPNLTKAPCAAGPLSWLLPGAAGSW